MWRILILPFLFMLTASTGLPDPIKAGAVLAELDLTQQALFSVMFVTVCLALLVIYLVSAVSTARKDLKEISKDFAAAAVRMTEGASANDTQIAVQLALIQANQTDMKAGIASLTARQQ